jgi:hypothetical protein
MRLQDKIAGKTIGRPRAVREERAVGVVGVPVPAM